MGWHHPQHHQYSDEVGDPHSAGDGFFWSHVLWDVLDAQEKAIEELTHPTLYRLPSPALLSLLAATDSNALGVNLLLRFTFWRGWPFAAWHGACARWCRLSPMTALACKSGTLSDTGISVSDLYAAVDRSDHGEVAQQQSSGLSPTSACHGLCPGNSSFRLTSHPPAESVRPCHRRWHSTCSKKVNFQPPQRRPGQARIRLSERPPGGRRRVITPLWSMN